MSAVVASGLDVTYESVRGSVRALDGIDLAVESGEPISVIGPSGCGKTTLLLAIAGLIAPSRGTVTVAGEPVLRPRRRTALILQDFGLMPWKTVFGNVALGLAIRRTRKAVLRQVTARALEQVGLSEFASAYPGELSGGMRQRVAIARALALDADVLLMDEPLSALDALTRESLQHLLLDLWRERRHTQILVTHSIEEAVFLGRRIVVLSHRPAVVAHVVDNIGMGVESGRSSAEFLAACERVRGLLDAEGVFSEAGLRPVSAA